MPILSAVIHGLPLYPAYKSNASPRHLLLRHKGQSLICAFVFYSHPLLPLVDPRTLRYEDTLIIAFASVSMMAVVAVAAFFAYRMMHGELPWCHALRKSTEHLFFKAV